MLAACIVAGLAGWGATAFLPGVVPPAAMPGESLSLGSSRVGLVPVAPAPVGAASVRVWSPQPAGALVGVPVILDGDTLSIRGTRVRLNGIDAEEVAHYGQRAEPNGPAARAALQAIVGIGATVRCTLNGDRTHGREVGVCFNQRGQDIGAELVRRGLALDCARFSGGRYRALEPPGVRQRLVAKPYC